MAGEPTRNSRTKFVSMYLVCLPLAAMFLVGASDSKTRPRPRDGQGKAIPIGKLIVKDKSDLRLVMVTGIMSSSRPAVYVPLRELPGTLRDALIFQEDQGFFRHRGYSLREIQAAIFDSVFRFRRLRGASTITQQLARTLFLKRNNSLRRKLLELRIARVLETELNKQRILELYLNNVYWGNNRYGIAAASAFYFGKKPGRLELSESAFLIALLPNPDGCKTPPRAEFERCRSERIRFRQRRLRKFLASKRERSLRKAGSPPKSR